MYGRKTEGRGSYASPSETYDERVETEIDAVKRVAKIAAAANKSSPRVLLDRLLGLDK